MAAFVGSNIEPSVRSCLERAGISQNGGDSQEISIEAQHFLGRLQHEPQSFMPAGSSSIGQQKQLKIR